MNTKLFNTIFALVCLLGVAVVASAQAPGVTPKAVAFTTAPKLTIAKLKNGDQDVYEVRGKTTFTITAANSDDTLAGTFTYTIPDDARQKIAATSGKPLNTIPANVTRKDVLAYFQEGTLAPVIHLELKPMEFDVAGLKMAFNRVVVDVNGRDSTSSYYSKEEMEALFTVWAKQIYNKRSRRGIVTRVNKVINGEPEQ
jgi:hypothetical protein